MAATHLSIDGKPCNPVIVIQTERTKSYIFNSACLSVENPNTEKCPTSKAQTDTPEQGYYLNVCILQIHMYLDNTAKFGCCLYLVRARYLFISE